MPFLGWRVQKSRKEMQLTQNTFPGRQVPLLSPMTRVSPVATQAEKPPILQSESTSQEQTDSNKAQGVSNQMSVYLSSKDLLEDVWVPWQSDGSGPKHGSHLKGNFFQRKSQVHKERRSSWATFSPGPQCPRFHG